MVTRRLLNNFLSPRRICAAIALSMVLAVPATAQEKVERSFAVALVRDVLTAINHGNWTGNYTVLRDYASRDFAEVNDPTRLAGLFTALREAGLDMMPILVVEPTLLQTEVSARGDQIRLTGYFPTEPQHFSFDMVFVNESRRWLLFDISVGAFDPITEQDRPAASGESSAEDDETSPESGD
ncbi:hypothetical protein [Salipiger pallidus]|nr:hypothetical protein [Salipiger pallidus]